MHAEQQSVQASFENPLVERLNVEYRTVPFDASLYTMYHEDNPCSHTLAEMYSICPSCLKKYALLQYLFEWLGLSNRRVFRRLLNHRHTLRSMSGISQSTRTIYRGISTYEVFNWPRCGSLYEYQSKDECPESWTTNVDIATLFAGRTPCSFVMECQLQPNDPRVFYDTTQPSPYHNYKLGSQAEIIMTGGKRWFVKVHFTRTIEEVRLISPLYYKIYMDNDKWAASYEARCDEEKRRARLAEKYRTTKRLLSSTDSTMSGDDGSPQRKRSHKSTKVNFASFWYEFMLFATLITLWTIQNVKIVEGSSSSSQSTQEFDDDREVCTFLLFKRMAKDQKVWWEVKFKEFEMDNVQFKYNFNGSASVYATPNGRQVADDFPLALDKHLVTAFKHRQEEHPEHHPHIVSEFTIEMPNVGTFLYVYLYLGGFVDSSSRSHCFFE